MEEESNGELAFLDTLLKQNNGEVSVLVYRSLHILTNTYTTALITKQVARKTRYFFHFFKSLVFWVVKGGGGPGGKGQKMAQSEKKNSHSVSQELYLIWLRFLLLMCKLTSPATFFHFSKF